MSVNFKAIAVIGCEIDPKQLVRECRVPHTKHHVPSGAKFCPECGASAETTRTINIFYDEIDVGIKPFEIWCGTDQKCVVVGYGVCTEWNGYISEKIDLIEIKDELKKRLSPLGWWNEDKFGMYAILYCSY